jgi:hypothetical protein
MGAADAEEFVWVHNAKDGREDYQNRRSTVTEGKKPTYIERVKANSKLSVMILLGWLAILLVFSAAHYAIYGPMPEQQTLNSNHEPVEDMARNAVAFCKEQLDQCGYD